VDGRDFGETRFALSPDHDEETNMTDLPDIPLPAGIRSRYVDDINGLRMHVLEAGFETKGRPCILLLHGFPELAFSWRKVMPALSSAGYHVIAPDQRGYGRTTGLDEVGLSHSGHPEQCDRARHRAEGDDPDQPLHHPLLHHQRQ
jgi:pimeloyl-ACP methyl ester carboxylesterase